MSVDGKSYVGGVSFKRFGFVLSPILLVEISVKLVFILLLLLLLLGIGTLWSFLAGHLQATEYR